MKLILDKHLKKFKGEVSLVKTYYKDGKKVRVIKIKNGKKKQKERLTTEMNETNLSLEDVLSEVRSSVEKRVKKIGMNAN